MLPTKFQVKWPFESGKDRKVDFQDGGYGNHLGFPIGTILAIFNLQVTPMLPTKFQVKWPFSVQGKKRKIDFQNGGHGGILRFPIEMILAIFDLSTKFQVNWSFGSGREAKNRFSKMAVSWTADQNEFSYF